MLITELCFPAGRLHATPWGHHVNAGAVEWPPSPWRILRALVATWHLKAKVDVPESVMHDLVHTLASTYPIFQLPLASLGHTRHYMPLIEGKKQKVTKVFDTFIHMNEPLRIAWDISLTAEQNRALGLLCKRLGYFGRAESLVIAKALLTDNSIEPNAQPLLENNPIPVNRVLVRLLAPVNEDVHSAWLANQTAVQLTTPAKGKRGKTGKTSSLTLPATIFDALHADTGELQTAGWTSPPGSQWVDYIRSADCFDLEPVRPRLQNCRPTVAHFAVTSTVLPRITRAVSVAERVHQTLTLLSQFPDGSAPEVFTGRDKNGNPLAGHQHAFILCEANGARDVITHVTVFAQSGFDTHARRALESLSLREVWGHGGHNLRFVLLGFGKADTDMFRDTTLFGKARVWHSLTPFVPTRHPKSYRDGRPKLDSDGWPIGSPEHDLRRLITQAGLPMPVKVEKLREITTNSRRLRPLEFQTERRHGGGTRAHRSPAAFQITFAEPRCGPLAFGYGAHFGLGLFVRADNQCGGR